MSVLSEEREYERLSVYICVVGGRREREKGAPLRLAAAPSDDTFIFVYICAYICVYLCIYLCIFAYICVYLRSWWTDGERGPT